MRQDCSLQSLQRLPRLASCTLTEMHLPYQIASDCKVIFASVLFPNAGTFVANYEIYRELYI